MTELTVEMTGRSARSYKQNEPDVAAVCPMCRNTQVRILGMEAEKHMVQGQSRKQGGRVAVSFGDPAKPGEFQVSVDDNISRRNDIARISFLCGNCSDIFTVTYASG